MHAWEGMAGRLRRRPPHVMMPVMPSGSCRRWNTRSVIGRCTMADELVVSIAQMAVAANEPQRNVETAARAIGEGARRGSDLVVLPELWTTGLALREATGMDSPGTFDAVSAMRDLARTNRVAVAGSALLRDGDHFHNVLVLVTAEGRLVA